jgi:hypothetical protein
MKTPWTQCAQMCSNVVKLSSRACHVRRLVLHGTSGAIPAAFLYTDLYALGVAKSTDQALVVVFLATLTCSMVGMDSAIISFLFFYMILYDLIWSWYIPPENPCVLWWSWKAANVTHGYDSRLSGSLLKQTCYPHKWKTSHVEANPVQVTWTYILQRPPFTRQM